MLSQTIVLAEDDAHDEELLAADLECRELGLAVTHCGDARPAVGGDPDG